MAKEEKRKGSENQRDRTVPPLRSNAEKWDGRPGIRDPTGRRTVMTVTILRRTFNVRISVIIFGIEIEISVQ